MKTYLDNGRTTEYYGIILDTCDICGNDFDEKEITRHQEEGKEVKKCECCRRADLWNETEK